MKTRSFISLICEAYKFSSTQIDLPEEQADAMLRWSELNIPEDALGEDGRETEPHVTCKFGLVSDVAAESLKRIIETTKPFAVRLGRVRLFDTKPDYDVVILPVYSPGLRRLNLRIAASQPHGDTWPSYQPHATLAYVQKGRADELVGSTLFGEGGPSDTFTPRELVFSSRDGSTLRFPFGGKPPASQDSPEDSSIPTCHVAEAMTEVVGSRLDLDPFLDLPFPVQTEELRRFRAKRSAASRVRQIV